ncbi:5-formyltetrahydrofolate cyclo-ligase [Pluteus cervinus]|uniref:5-formyltetrahydrofolate cyclo-ligase n=1 Tax=Pluteus cervinus TaxID=181527 RepID=A0ACD3B3M0_9AGAR|nr:5-formyltetrahydrofolate cyclo-ligase [Pluteus cervinus]
MATTTGSLTIRAQKKVLRKLMAGRLNALPQPSIELQSRAVTERILSLPEYQRCRSVSCYLSMPSGELQTASLVSEIIRSGKSLFVPKFEAKSEHMDFLKIYGADDLSSLPAGLWGIPQPDRQWENQPRQSALDVEGEGLDLVFLPGVAFDRSMSRLGHGKGYYDRFLTTYNSGSRPRPLLVALALSEQLLDGGEIPTDSHDWKVDYIITPEEIIPQSL